MIRNMLIYKQRSEFLTFKYFWTLLLKTTKKEEDKTCQIKSGKILNTTNKLKNSNKANANFFVFLWEY